MIEIILDNIELIFGVLFLIYFLYALTKEFGIKGFLGSIAICVFGYVLSVMYDKILDKMLELPPWIVIIIFLIIFGICIVVEKK